LASGTGLLSDPQANTFLTSYPDAQGGFTIEDVFPGPYLIEAPPDSPPAPYYLDSIRLGNHEALESNVPILSDAEPLTFTYKLDGGNVRGTIEDCGAARVLLIPQNPALCRGAFIRTTSCAPNGGFEFSPVRPGEYFGFAIAWWSPTLWYGAVPDDGLLSRPAESRCAPMSPLPPRSG